MKDFIKVTECPKCGDKELGKGIQSGYGSMSPNKKISVGSNIEYIICVRCGYIIEGYVTNPEKFKGTFSN
ncbi:transcription initiation factor TFIIIB [Priestia megaterium]|uniref:transcription initiation factor TFIIIB n=1 Tax=Priestia megaterium TaxID=1404 RepID=UPI00159C80B3|nr:transcription initiation factor TFIIIB [Priestia megaterium]